MLFKFKPMKALILQILLVFLFSPAFAYQLTEETSASGFNYILGQPEVITSETKTLLLLHGCAQSAKSVYKLSEVESHAKELNLVLITPSQTTSRNPIKCWNFYEEESHAAGIEGSEVEKLVALLAEVQEKLGLQQKGFKVIGFSSGGAQAMNLFACYPQLIDAAAIHSGLPHAIATSRGSAWKAASNGPQVTTDYLHESYKKCSGNTDGRKLMVVHGDKDNVVDVANGRAIMAQVLGRELTDEDFGELRTDDSEHPYKEAYLTSRSNEYYYIEVQGMKHKWSGSQADHRIADSKGPAVTQTIFEFLYR